MRLHDAFVCLRIAAEEQQKLLLVSKAIHVSLSLTASESERERERELVRNTRTEWGST